MKKQTPVLLGGRRELLLKGRGFLVSLLLIRSLPRDESPRQFSFQDMLKGRVRVAVVPAAYTAVLLSEEQRHKIEELERWCPHHLVGLVRASKEQSSCRGSFESLVLTDASRRSSLRIPAKLLLEKKPLPKLTRIEGSLPGTVTGSNRILEMLDRQNLSLSVPKRGGCGTPSPLEGRLALTMGPWPP